MAAPSPKGKIRRMTGNAGLVADAMMAADTGGPESFS
jgi:hypothetical protein